MYVTGPNLIAAQALRQPARPQAASSPAAQSETSFEPLTFQKAASEPKPAQPAKAAEDARPPVHGQMPRPGSQLDIKI